VLVSKALHSYRVIVPSQFQSVEVECFEVVTDTAAYRFIVLYRPPEFEITLTIYVIVSIVYVILKSQ